MTLAEIEARLQTAIRALMATSDPDARYLGDVRAHWPAAIRDLADIQANALEQIIIEVGSTPAQDVTAAKGYDAPQLPRSKPTPAEIDAMIPTLLWLQCLHKREKRLLWLRALDWDFHRLAGKFRRPEANVRTWYAHALRRVRQYVLDCEVRTVI